LSKLMHNFYVKKVARNVHTYLVMYVENNLLVNTNDIEGITEDWGQLAPRGEDFP
jgi:hypothetical protein